MLEYVRQEADLIRSGRRTRDRLAMIAMSGRLHLSARGVELPGARRGVSLDLREEIVLRLRPCDYFVVLEILGLRAYDIDTGPLGRVESVLDAGANIGLASIYFAKRFPQARFVCVEPSLGSHALLVRNLRANVGDAQAVLAAVTATPTMVAVDDRGRPVLARVTPDTRAGDRPVPGRTIPELLDATGIDEVDFMKLDIEGGEQSLLANLDGWWNRVRSLLAEIHPPLGVGDAGASLAAHGFEPLPLPHDPKFARLVYAIRR